MQKITFQNLPNTTTPINATNLNAIQTNAETAINDVAGDLSDLSVELTTAIDLFNETSGSDWKAMMKNKIDYCIANLNTTKSNCMTFINGGWSGTGYGFGLFSKIGNIYQLTWNSTRGTYYVSKNANDNYTYRVLGGNDYNASEEEIGKWINGKPLYRQTFGFTNIPIGQETSILWNNSGYGNSVYNIDEIINYKAFYHRYDNNDNLNSFQQVPTVHSNMSMWGCGIYDLNSNGFTFWVGTLGNLFKVKLLLVTIEYTKTTD